MGESTKHPLIFVPVGTSLLTNAEKGEPDLMTLKKGKDVQSEKYINVCRRYQKLNKIFPGSSGVRPGRNWNRHPAETSSLYAFCRERWGAADAPEAVRVCLLHAAGKVGTFCAGVLQKLLKNKDYLSFPDLPKLEKIDWNVELEPLERLDPEDPDGFHIALDNLADIVAEKLRGHEGEVYINISGGYKPLGSYLTLMAMALGHRVKVFYLYEQSPKIHFLPSYPLSFDLLQWRDWRGLLLPFMHGELFSPRQQENFYAALLETPVGGLVRRAPKKSDSTKDGGCSLNSVGRILKKLYEQERREDVSRFGRGHLLLDLLRRQKPSWADYLEKYCIPRWQHLAVGDHIPETVEHGRGHVQRLLELARQLLEILAVTDPKLELTAEQLFVLIGAVWLHDLGHSGDEFAFEGEDGLVQKDDDPSSTESFFVYGDPDQVRKYHNFLSWHIIKEELKKGQGNFLFPAAGAPADLERLVRSIALAALYHRRAMPVMGGKVVGCCKVGRGIRDLEEGGEVIAGFPLVAALLRVLDGAENQQERSGSPASVEVTEWVIERQTASMDRYLKQKGLDDGAKKRLEKECKFKESQPGHYRKHRLVSHVFFALEEQGGREGIDPKFVYGVTQGEASDRLVGFYLVANPDEKSAEREETILKDIIKPFFEEFQLVEELLPFRLVIYLVSESENDARKEAILRQALIPERARLSKPLSLKKED